jgi:hypothetical protein
MPRRLPFVLIALGIVLAPVLHTQTLRGPEILVSSAANSSAPQVAVATNGDFVVTWQSRLPQPGQTPRIWYRLYRADGVPKGKALRASGSPAGEFGPSIGLGEDGSFVIVWEGGDDRDRSVFGRRFDVQGEPLSGRFRLSTITDGSQIQATVARAADGGFLAAWTSGPEIFPVRLSDVYIRRFDAAGKPLGPEAPAGVNTFHEQSEPLVVAIENGSFLVGWTSFGGEGTFYDVFARRFDDDGTPLGEEFEVSNSEASVVSQYGFALAAAADGSFVVVWTDDAGDPNPDDDLADPVGLVGQRYAADDSLAGGRFQVNATTKGSQLLPKVTLSPQGPIFVTWLSANHGLLGRRFRSDGRPFGSEFVLDENGGVAAVDMASSGRGIVAWATPEGVFVRKLVAPAANP